MAFNTSRLRTNAGLKNIKSQLSKMTTKEKASFWKEVKKQLNIEQKYQLNLKKSLNKK